MEDPNKDLKKEWSKRELKNWLYALGIFLLICVIFTPAIFFSPTGFATLWVLILFGLMAAGFAAYIFTPIVLRFLRPVQDEKFSDMVEQLSKKAGIKKAPTLTLARTPEINAIAYNSIFGKRIGITTGLTQAHYDKKLTDQELEGILAHELGHHKSLDTLKISFVFSFVSLIQAMGYLIMVMGSALGEASEEIREPTAGLVSTLIIGILTLTGLLMRLFSKLVSALAFHFSRVLEYRADAFGADLRGPETMANTLRKINDLNNQLVAKQVAALPYANRWQLKPTKLSWVDKLFSTHPPTEKRIDALLSRKG